MISKKNVYLFDKKATPEDLTKNGLGVIDCITATNFEEINGEYSCKIETFEKIEAEQIVRMETPRGPDYFRLAQPERRMTDSGVLRSSVQGWHISYDLADDIILNSHFTGSANTIAAGIAQSGIYDRRFTGSSDIEGTNTIYIIRKSPLAALISDDENAFINRFGGEIERKQWSVRMKKRLGNETGASIRYRKNMTGLRIYEDADHVTNRIVPTYLKADTVAAMLPEKYLDSPRIAETAVPHAVHIHYGDIEVGREVEDEAGNKIIPYPTEASAEAAVRARVADLWGTGIDHLDIHADVTFIHLSDSEEGQELEALTKLSLGDDVKIVYKNDIYYQRIKAYEWNALTGRYIRLELGAKAPDMAGVINALQTSANEKTLQTAYEYTDRGNKKVGVLIDAQQQLMETVAQSMGYKTEYREGPNGKRICYMYDGATLEASNYIATIPEPGTYAWTTKGWNNGHPVWEYGHSKDGNAIYRSIATEKLLANFIDASMIKAYTITGEQIAAGSISVDKLKAFSISADDITTGRLTSRNGANYIDLDQGTAQFQGNIYASNIQNTAWNSAGTSINQYGYQATTAAVANQCSFNSGAIASGVQIGGSMYASGTGIFVNGYGYVCAFETQGQAWLAIHRGSGNDRFNAANLIWGVTTSGQIVTSDRKTKKNITRFDDDNALKFIAETSLWEFDRRQDDQHAIGVIANLLARSDNPLAKLIVGRYEGTQGESVLTANYDNLAIINVGAVRALNQKVETLEARVNQLEKLIIENAANQKGA